MSLIVVAAFISQAPAQMQVPVTPASGESWLIHLHRQLENTSMGKTARLGPPTLLPASAEEYTARVQRLAFETSKQSVTLQGADLYRLNCRGCHGEFGLGAPPEINSVVDATRATSAAYMIARLQQRGLETSRAQANEMANQAKATVLERLHKGGVDMPPFPHLSDPEVRAIFAYLRQLAELPGAEKQQLHLDETPVRVGEHIVKSTCHICHSAAGVNPSPDQLLQGTIPPLSSLTTRVTLLQFEQKVRHGAPIMMGTPLLPYRGRMPVFDYLTESEVADAYMYLKLYPPTMWSEPLTPPNPPQTAIAIAAVVSNSATPSDPPRGQAAEAKASSFLPAIAQIFVSLLVVGGAVFTLYEVRRSKAPGTHRLDLWARRLASRFGIGGPVPVNSRGTSSRASNRAHSDAHKQAAWQSRFSRSEYHSFESSWLSRRWEEKDGAA